VVHGVHLSDAALRRLRDAGAVIVTCPRSNLWVGSGPSPISRFYRAGLSVAIGTDSLASADSLSLFDELAAARSAAPDIPARRLLDSATRVGAEALGFGTEFGTLEAGKRAALVAVEIPAGEDVEEYLVSGVPASRVTRPAAPSR
jgi:cytosine/adenosine deaminase-related metal-dependent hydrolase